MFASSVPRGSKIPLGCARVRVIVAQNPPAAQDGLLEDGLRLAHLSGLHEDNAELIHTELCFRVVSADSCVEGL